MPAPSPNPKWLGQATDSPGSNEVFEGQQWGQYPDKDDSGTPFPGFGGTPPNTSATSSAGVSALAARADHTHGAVIADWGGAGSTRYFACDVAAGNDANPGWSDVSQADAGLVAVKTLSKLLSIVPRIGNGRNVRIAIRSGNYASDTIIDLSGFQGYNRILIIGTNTIPSAGAVAFAGDTNDTIACGMTTATGMNVAGYNPTAYSVAADGTPTITCQLVGGGAPAFPAAPAQPYGARLRFDVNTTTAALRNKAYSVIFSPANNQLITGLPLAAAPDASDIFYLEMANVTGPTTTYMSSNESMFITGLNLGIANGRNGSASLSGCELAAVVGNNLNLQAGKTAFNVPAGSITVGLGIRTGGNNLMGGIISISDSADSGLALPSIYQGTESFLWERSSAPGMVVYGGNHTLGNNVVEQIGTNSSTAHGATCQIWAPQTTNTPAGTRPCGLAVYGGYSLGRIKFSNMGTNPAAVIGGTGLGVRIQGLSGTAADGNNDVGIDLSPSGLSGNTIGAMGCNVSIVGSPTVAGALGDVRLSDGTIVSWANATAGIADANGNQIFGAGNAPTHPIPVAAGAVSVAMTNAPAGSPAAPARYFKFPDGVGGFYTVPSLT